MSLLSGEILAKVYDDLAERQSRIPLDEVKARALTQPSAMDGVCVLRGGGVGVIGELEASRVSMGVLAGEYELGGVNVVSVPVASDRSVETLQAVREVRARVQVPVLCKNLIVSGYQLWEARAYGADLVLLVAAALEQEALVSLVERTESIGMTAIVEVRDERELLRAVGAGARIINVNARDHAALDVDQDANSQLLPLIPEGIVRVAECGQAGRAGLIACARAGADAVVVGAAQLAGTDPRAAMAGLVSVGAHPALSRGRRQVA